MFGLGLDLSVALALILPLCRTQKINDQIALLLKENSPLLTYPTDFTRNIVPKPIHSHNDFEFDILELQPMMLIMMQIGVRCLSSPLLASGLRVLKPTSGSSTVPSSYVLDLHLSRLCLSRCNN